MNQSQHIEKVFHKQTSQQIADNRLLLKASIDSIRWLACQGCAFRGRDERPEFKDQDNFIEMVKFLAEYNGNVAATALENAIKTAKYTSPMIQKEILNIFTIMVQTTIREEFGEAKFCIIIDDAWDESKGEQMALILRFVDKDGVVRERLFDLVHVSDTNSSTLHRAISTVLSRHNLDIQNLRGQGYDGVSNMRGEWNDLQALFLKDCPYAYNIHCFAHHLRLALVTGAREVSPIYQFFSTLTSVVNVVGACKCHDELQATQAAEIASMLAIDELETGNGLDQIGNLQHPRATCWGSHFNSISSFVKICGATCSVLENIIEEGSTYAQRGDADHIFKVITSFEFVLIMGITNDLCQALQRQSQDILNAMHLVSTSKTLIQQFRDMGWDTLLENVKLFCAQYDIDIPDMDARYTAGRGWSRRLQDHITMEHYYRNIFNAAIDFQLQELNTRFNERIVELLILSAALDPKDGFKSFNIDDICHLVDKFYPLDFTEQKKLHLKYQLQHYERDVIQHPDLRKMSTVAELCRGLMNTGKSTIYPLIDRLIRLVLTLPVSTATTERAFSVLKIIDEFFGDCLLLYVENELVAKFTTDMIIDEFYSMKERRAQLK